MPIATTPTMSSLVHPAYTPRAITPMDATSMGEAIGRGVAATMVVMFGNKQNTQREAQISKLVEKYSEDGDSKTFLAKCEQVYEAMGEQE